MLSQFKSSYKLTRQKIELFYSVFLLIIVPVILALNTIIFTSAARSHFDIELRRKADLANQVFGSSIKPILTQQDKIQATLNDIVKARDDVIDINVVIPTEDGQLLIVASKDSSLIGRIVSDLQYDIVIERQRSVAQLLESEETGRVWSTVTPIIENGKVVAITSMSLSINEADILIAGLLQRSFMIMIVTVVVTVLLLWNHFKFVEYAQLFRKLKEADQLKSDFLSVATHELKAPMTAIKGYVANVMDGTSGTVSVEAMEQLNVVIHQTDRLNSLVQDLLNISRIEQGQIEFKMGSVVVADIINPIVQRYQNQAKVKDIEIIYHQPIQGTAIYADSGRFEEIMTNLIDNAVKYSTHGEIVISHEISGKMLKTSVRDNGIGMTSAERERLFQRFYRIKNEDTKAIGGTGLGLWIIKQYIEKMGGKISVDSMKNVGTEFIVELNLPK